MAIDGLVNFKYSRIFNGVFEKQKSTKNEKRFRGNARELRMSFARLPCSH